MLRCDSCGQDLSLISRGHYTVLCHKEGCASLKDGKEANVALVKAVRALGLANRKAMDRIKALEMEVGKVG